MLIAGDTAAQKRRYKKPSRSSSDRGERFWLADLHRLDGRVALKRAEPDRARAEASFLKAIEIARKPGSPHARTARRNRTRPPLARRGSPKDPRSLLEPILAAIEGGETMRDVRSARALLAEIA